MDSKKINRWLSALKCASDKKEVLVAILNDCTFDELECLFNKAPAIYKGLLSLSFLRRKGYNQLFGTNCQPRRNPEEYIGVLVYVIKRHSSLISRYVSDKIEVDRAVLKGEYQKARKLIDSINKTIGFSYWAATYLIKIERLENGLSACTKLYNRLISENKSVVQYVYFCAYRSSSLDFLIDDVKRVLLTSDKPYAEFLNGFLISHCMPYWDFKEGDWMCSDMNSSLIDLYNNLVNYLPNLSEKVRNDSSVRRCIKELQSCVDDLYLKKLCYLWGIIDEAVIEEERNAILESFYAGNYELALGRSECYLEKNPEDFEVQSAYLKSLVIQGGGINQPDNSGCLIDIIQYHLSALFAHEPNASFHRRRLVNICRSQYQIYGIRYLYSLLEGIETNDFYHLYDKAWKYSRYNSPFDAGFFNDRDNRRVYIQRLSNNNSFWDSVFSDTPSAITDNCYELSVASLNRDDAFDLLLKRFKEESSLPYLLDLISTFLFNCFIDSRQFIDGIRFYVESRLDDDALTIGFRDKETIIHLLEDKTLSTQIPLDLSIFSEMVGADAETTYFIYKKVLKQHNVSKASEMTVNGDRRIKFFLESVAVPKVLTLHVLRFKSVQDVMEERSLICSNLYDFYQDKDISDEISSICRDIKIKELNNQVDESKIFVDVQSIKENESEEEQALYDMFESASNQVEFKDIVVGELVSRLARYGVQAAFVSYNENGDIEFSRGSVEQVNYRKSVMTQIFKGIRDKFLFNPKYGLDNYLSTRIRHGTLVNQLRNHFEDKLMVTNTIDGEYSNNEYWISHEFKLRDSRTLKCIRIFNNFSLGIDTIIAEIKDSYVQVQTERNRDKKNGCFDYGEDFFLEDINRMLIDESISSFEACYNFIIESLWQRTEKCLEGIREKLNEAQGKMIVLLHSLQRDIVNVVGNNPKINVFNDAISYCQNGIQKDFQIVNKWFKRSNYVDFDFTIGQVIDTSIGFIRRNNTNLLKTRIEDNSSSTFKGQYFGTLYDIFHDILNNALDYEKKKSLGGLCHIKVDESDGWIGIMVSNPIRQEDVLPLQQKVDEINRNLAETVGKGKTRNEKNSGCSKIFNAVKYHLGSQSNQYVNKIEDGQFVVSIQINLAPIKK